MPIIQEAFDIPNDIMTKLLTGEYRRIGGIIRYATGPNKGQIVKHLEPIDLKPAQQVQSIGAKVIQFAKRNKKVLIVSGVAVAAVTVGSFVYCKVKNREPEVVTTFRSELKTYIEEVRTGTLKLSSIENLLSALEAVKSHKDSSNIIIELSTEELDVLVNRIYEYTKSLAEMNEYPLNAEDIKKYSLAKVESLFHIRHEDGTVQFFEQPLDPNVFAKVVLVKEDGELVPLEGQDSMEKIKMVRTNAKKKVFVTNAIRSLAKVSPTGNVRDIEFVVLVGGSALDFEVPTLVTDALSQYNIVAGRGNIRGCEGPRNAVATGLAMSCADV